MPYSFAQLMTILMLIGVVFVIISEMFLERISINLVLLLLLNFEIAFKLEFISLIEIIKSSFIHLFHGLQLPLLLAQTNHFFCLYQQEKSTYKQKFRQTSNYCKMALEAAKLAYVNEAKESIASQKFGLHDFWQIANSILNKGKSAISLYSMTLRCCPLRQIKQNCLLKTFPRTLFLTIQVSLDLVSLLELI